MMKKLQLLKKEKYLYKKRIIAVEAQKIYLTKE